MRERLCILKMGVTPLPGTDDVTLLQSAVRAIEVQGRPPPIPIHCIFTPKKYGTPWAGRYHIILMLKIQFQHGQQGLTTVGTKLLHRKPRKNIQPHQSMHVCMYVHKSNPPRSLLLPTLLAFSTAPQPNLQQKKKKITTYKRITLKADSPKPTPPSPPPPPSAQRTN